MAIDTVLYGNNCYNFKDQGRFRKVGTRVIHTKGWRGKGAALKSAQKFIRTGLRSYK